MAKANIGIIGGSGLYQIDGIKVTDEISVKTPWGHPSDSLIIAEIGGVATAFLPRHGRGHGILPHEVNYRANIAAFKMIGVDKIIAFSAVGSLKEEIRPLDFILPSQVIDRTKGRASSFFGEGIAAHIGFGDPFCATLGGIIAPIATEAGLKLHTGETLICMEGPAFSSRAESNLYRSWGAGIINMSTLPEAKLAREAEICYSVVCMSTDYDCWKMDEEHVSVEMVVANLAKNAANAHDLIKAIVPRAASMGHCSCNEASKYAVITAKERWSKKQAKRLRSILPEYF